MPARRPMWTCPRCGERFVSPNLWHSCGRYTRAALFRNSQPHVARIFDRLARLARRCGPVRVYPQKTRVVIQARIRFMNGTPRRSAFVAGFLLPRGTTSARFSKVEDYRSRHYVGCYVPLATEDEVDAEVARWMRQAYRIGRQEHLK
jgi:hypothetical protein